MISCGDYDYIEIACSFRYPIRLTLKSGDTIDGTAKDTALNEAREECILLELDNNERLVVLDELVKMQAKVKNPHFDLVSFIPE